MRSLPFSRTALTVLVLALAASSASGDSDEYGSKVELGDPDMGLALSPFYVSPEFAFWDKNENERLDPDEVVYLNINPTDDVVSENDVRLTDFVDPPTTYHAGSQVSIGDFDLGRKLIKFGTAKNPRAELRYIDMDDKGPYSFEDEIYLIAEPVEVSQGDIRITGFLPSSYVPGSRVTAGEDDISHKTLTLPGMLSFLNKNGNINNGGYAIYDKGDVVYIDTQYPFYVVTVNDVRLSDLDWVPILMEGLMPPESTSFPSVEAP